MNAQPYNNNNSIDNKKYFLCVYFRENNGFGKSIDNWWFEWLQLHFSCLSLNGLTCNPTHENRFIAFVKGYFILPLEISL